MIVRNVESGWEIVFQSAHALLAGCLAMNLRQIDKIHYWPETLAAILDHDDHKESFGSNVYLTELGAPKDFTLVRFTGRERFDEALRRIDSGYRKHRWIGLLAARHAEELYAHERVSNKLAHLLSAELKKRPILLHQLKSTLAALESAYSVFQWCDRASLILCQKAIPAMHRRIEIASLGDAKRYELWENTDGSLSIEPWPFNSIQFEIHLEVRTLLQLTFGSDRELEQSLRDSAVEDRRWKFRKSEPQQLAGHE